MACLSFHAGFKTFTAAEISSEGKWISYQLPQVKRNTTTCTVQAIAQPRNHQTVWCTGSDIFCIHVYGKFRCIRKAIYSLQFYSCVTHTDSHSCPPLSMLFSHGLKDPSVDRNLLIDFCLVSVICFWGSILPTDSFEPFNNSLFNSSRY